MAQQGFDPTFGLRGTCASDVSGFGGWPLGVFVGIDGRPTVVCRATAQKKTDRDDVGHANRFQKPRFSTLRVVSFPLDGRPVPISGVAKRTAVLGPDPVAHIYARRAIVSRDRVAILCFEIRANREVPILAIFTAGQIQNGVASWSLSRTAELESLSSISGRQYAMGWIGGDVVVVAPRLVATGVELVIYTDKDQRTVTVRFPRPAKLDLPADFDVNLRAGGVAFVKPDRLYLGLTWEGLDPSIVGLRPAEAIDQGRASAVALRMTTKGFAIHPGFGDGGIWLAGSIDGEITTTDHLVIGAKNRPAIAGRAKRGATTSLFAASFGPNASDPLWTSYPGAGVLSGLAGMTAARQDRFLLCGTTRDWDINAPSDNGDAVVIRLRSNGQPDTGFGNNGVVRFRLHGGTHPTACAETDAGEPLIASIVPWGWQAAATSVQPCLTRLTPSGDLDPAFGSAGLCRHDGLGSAELVAVDPAGRAWSAGIVQSFLGAANNPQWMKILTVSRLDARGELDSAFGLNGIATFQLPAWEDLEVTTVIPVAGGGAVLNGTAKLRGVTPTTAGSWFLAVQDNGRIDTTFGGRRPNGTCFYAGRDVVLVSALANGVLQGFENGDVVRFAANGTPAGGAQKVAKPLVNPPSVIEPSGDFLSLVFGKVTNPFEVGLVRFHGGAIDATFGAGGPPSTTAPGNPDPRFVNLASLGVPARVDQLVGGDQTIALADGTFLTLWTLREDESVSIIGSPDIAFTTSTLLLLAWDTDGRPRTIPAWGRPGRIIKNPAGTLRNWIGWSYKCSVLQPDGSIIVCLAGDDGTVSTSLGAAPPLVVSQIPYFCRLIPPNFELDPAFGGAARFLAQRAPGCDFVVPKGTQTQAPDMAEGQVPVVARLVSNGAVAIAIRCKHPNPNFGGIELQVPNLPLDGSVGMARLV